MLKKPKLVELLIRVRPNQRTWLRQYMIRNDISYSALFRRLVESLREADDREQALKKHGETAV